MIRVRTLLLLIAVLLWSSPDGALADASFRRADANSDGALDIADPVSLLNYLFLGAEEPACLDAADSTDDGALDISDAVRALGFLFLGAAPPPPPFPGCGVDPTEDGLACASYAPCVGPVYVNIQVDAELEDVDGIARLVSELERRAIPSTVYVTAEYANRNALLITDFYTRGFEIALHGYYTGEQLATMTYEEQKDLLGRAKAAVEGCTPCGTGKTVIGFRPQYFSQNEDTFRVLDELGLTHDSGFKARQLSLPGFEWAERPYRAPGHAFTAVPLATIPRGGDRIYLCDIACAQVVKMTSEEWRAALLTGLEQSLASREPLAILLHGWYTGDTALYDYWQPFLDFLDAAQGQVTFVNAARLCELYAP